MAEEVHQQKGLVDLMMLRVLAVLARFEHAIEGATLSNCDDQNFPDRIP